VALVGLTKQLAEQALSETLGKAKTPAPAPTAGEDACAVMLGQVQAMQKALKDEDELVVLCHSGSETLRVLEIIVPSPNVLVLAGIDANRNVTRIVTHLQALQLVCKVVKVQPPAKPARIAFIVPKQPPRE
jgi:hypothetical protein